MTRRKQLKIDIELLEEEMKLLEAKRNRSQAQIIECLISKQDPPADEVQFFRTFSAEIEVKRERLVELIKELKSL